MTGVNWTTQDVYAKTAPSGSTDNTGGSGVDHYEISTTGTSGWTTFSYNATYPGTTYKMSTSGTHTRYFRAVDKAGNASTAISRTAKIDKTAPTLSNITNSSGRKLGIFNNVILDNNRSTFGNSKSRI